ncbi:MAG: acyltransferase [Clostridia bacterium]|nr:acyltransferase [Clostridia bacterium]
MKKKKVYLEWMRVLAVFLVIFNHMPGYSLFITASGVPQAFLMYMSMLVRVNVPLFLMVSGAVLLNRQEDFLTVLKRRVGRIAAVLLLFSLGLFIGHTLYYTLIKGVAYDHSLRRFLYAFFSVQVEGAESYWYLYAFLGYLLMLPYLQRVARDFTRQDFIALVALRTLLSACVPMLSLLLTGRGLPAFRITGYFSVPLAVTHAFFYPLAGCYLDRLDIEKISRRKLARIALAGAAGLAVACLCTYVQAGRDGIFAQTYVQLFDYAAAIAAFLLIKRLTLVTFPGLCRGRTARAICLMGSLSFGVYLLDPYLKLIGWGTYSRLVSGALSPLGLSLGWCAVSMCVGGTIVWVLKKLPVFRKLL